MLRPAAEALARRGDHVIAVARREEQLAELAAAFGATPVTADMTRLEHARERIPEADSALVYGPATAEAVLPVLATVVRGRRVLLMTSAAASPAAVGEDFDLSALPSAGWCRLLLGWAEERARCRWHSAAEISAAAVRILDSGGEEVLGTVRPWRRRP